MAETYICVQDTILAQTDVALGVFLPIASIIHQSSRNPVADMLQSTKRRVGQLWSTELNVPDFIFIFGWEKATGVTM